MSAVRSVLAIFLTATASLVAVPRVSAESHAPAFDSASLTCALDDLEQKIEISDRLRVNLHQSTRIIAPNKCQHEGESELRELAASAASEEAYAFIPSLCTWIETGYHETGRSVRLDRPLVNKLIKCYQDVSLYHIHPGLSEYILWHFPAYTDMLVAVLIHGKFLTNPLFRSGIMRSPYAAHSLIHLSSARKSKALLRQ